MLGIRGVFLVGSGVGRGTILAASLLVLAAGLCLFDGEASHHDGDGQHEDGVSYDLCFGMIVTSLAVPLLAGPRVSGWVALDLPRRAYPVSLHQPDPPPKRSSLS
jgi:hypothetical protein